YLTIELRGAIPEELRPKLGALLYGCDICQDVCPWNQRFAMPVREPAFAARPFLTGDTRRLARRILDLGDEEFGRVFTGSPMTRARRRGLARNAAVVLGNIGDADDEPALRSALDDPEPLVREHAVWAL